MTCFLQKGTILTYSVKNTDISLDDLKSYYPNEENGSNFNEISSNITLEYKLLKDLNVLNIPNYQLSRELSKFIKMMKATYPKEEIDTQYINRGLSECQDLRIKGKSRFSYLDETVYLNNSDIQFLSPPSKITVKEG